MKRNDITVIAVIIVFSSIISLIICNLLFGGPKSHNLTAEKVQPITADFQTPDKRYFNNQAFDPTKPITIGESANPDPFNGSGSGSN
jgi:hypothetical protein